jgi:cytochrome b561
MPMIRSLLTALRFKGAQAAPHGWPTKWVHWAAALLLLFAAVTNGDVTGALFSPISMRFEVGVGIALSVLYGSLWLWARGPGGGTRLPEQSPTWEKWAAKLVHNGLYLTIAAILATGFAMAWLAPSNVSVDAASEVILRMSPQFSFIRDTHEALSALLGWLFAAHFAGALWHKFIRQDGVLQSISLLRRRKPG